MSQGNVVVLVSFDFVFKDKAKGIHRLFASSACHHTSSSAVMKLTYAIFKLLLSGKFEKIAF